MMNNSTWEERFDEKFKHSQFVDYSSIKSFIAELITEAEERGKPKVGMLRQWLNEDRIDDPQKLVSNEDLEYWLEAARNTKKEV